MQNPVAAVTSADPYEFYAALAREPRLVWREGMWIAASPALVMEVMTHAACRVRPPAEPVPAAITGGSAGEVFAALVRMNEGERHASPKMALQRALGSVPLEQVRAVASRIARELAGATPMTAPRVSQWMMEVPVRTVASLLGFDDAQLPALAWWLGRFVACLSPLSSAAQIAAAHGASLELLDAFRALLQSPRAGSLLEAVVHEAEEAGWDNDHAILANLVGLLSQTYEATAGLIGNTVVALQRGASWPVNAASLVRDVARMAPPVQNTRRFVAEDAGIGGVRVQKGQVILLVLAAASRDPRAEGRVFGFGHGPHACPGQAMAEAIASAAIEALQDGLPRMQWRYRASVNARIPEFFEEVE
ncbi:cytochrome P450 [Pseudoduganella sp. RAF53_2]|uniref:cytochrome P450 n=1 Tax=unclassified Pseudoduganella TaxID=2637179 RepID=UPI003F9BC117